LDALSDWVVGAEGGLGDRESPTVPSWTNWYPPTKRISQWLEQLVRLCGSSCGSSSSWSDQQSQRSQSISNMHTHGYV